MKLKLWIEQDQTALDKLRGWFMTYPCDEEDVKMNEEIACAPLARLVDAVIARDNIRKLNGCTHF